MGRRPRASTRRGLNAAGVLTCASSARIYADVFPLASGADQTIVVQSSRTSATILIVIAKENQNV